MKTYICSFSEGDFRIKVDEKIYFFEMSRFGPLLLRKDGEPAKSDPTNKFLNAVTLWNRQGRKVQNGLCVYKIPKPDKVKHLGGRHYLIVEHGEDT